jgi:hypothetical protein
VKDGSEHGQNERRITRGRVRLPTSTPPLARLVRAIFSRGRIYIQASPPVKPDSCPAPMFCQNPSPGLRIPVSFADGRSGS